MIGLTQRPDHERRNVRTRRGTQHRRHRRAPRAAPTWAAARRPRARMTRPLSCASAARAVRQQTHLEQRALAHRSAKLSLARERDHEAPIILRRAHALDHPSRERSALLRLRDAPAPRRPEREIDLHRAYPGRAEITTRLRVAIELAGADGAASPSRVELAREMVDSQAVHGTTVFDTRGGCP